MDVLPTPKGYGFSGGDAWWKYILSHSERERLDHLIGLALLDNTVCEQLVTKRDPAFAILFRIIRADTNVAARYPGNTLKDLSQAIMASPKPSYLAAASWEAA